MPLSRFATDPSRASEVAGLVSCVALAALATWLLVRLLWALLPSDDVALGAVATRAESSGPAPTRSIAQWHLFGNAPVQASAAGSTTSLILRGTLADPDPKAGIAVIADAGNGERSWRVGEQVAPGVRLVAVYADRAVLSRDGAEETLKLARDTNLAPADVVRPTPASVTGGASPARAGDAAASGAAHVSTSVKAPANWQQTVDRLRRNPAELMKRVQVVPVLDGGKLSGVRLSTGTDVALLNQIGLQPGDVVTSVNGTPIDSIERGQQIMSSLGNASSVRVTVLRAGKPTDVTVGLQ